MLQDRLSHRYLSPLSAKNRLNRHGWVAAGFACLLLLQVGCGGGGVERSAVSGSVTLDGNPIEEGMILFSPLGEGPSAGGDIKNGQYLIEADRGPSPGSYRVEIRAYRGTGRTTHDAARGTTEEIKVPIIPARYHSNSELKVEITPEATNQHDFELKSK